MSEVYSRLLSQKGHGRANWIPELDENLPPAYRVEGMDIGDIIIAAPGSEIEFLFNAFKPASHPVNVDRVPKDFKPVMLKQRDVSKYSLRHSPGTVISSGRCRKNAFSAEISSKGAPCLPIGPGIGFNVDFRDTEGALVYLHEGASRENLLNADVLKSIDKRASEWSDIARNLGRPGPLVVVTGCDKASMWEMLSFSGASRSAGMSVMVSFAGFLDGKVSCSFTSDNHHYFDHRTSPTPTSSTRNYCIFFRGNELPFPHNCISKWIEKLPREVKSHLGPKPFERNGPAPSHTSHEQEQKYSQRDLSGLDHSTAADDSDSCPLAQDKSENLVPQATHHIASGERADLWVKRMSDKARDNKLKVVIKTLCGNSSSNLDFLAKLKEVSYAVEKHPVYQSLSKDHKYIP